jgi:hypothetical protein
VDLEAHHIARITAIHHAAHKNNGIAQVIPGYLVHFLALSTLWNERQAKEIVLTWNGIHPELHKVEIRTTKIAGMQSKPPTAAIALREITKRFCQHPRRREVDSRNVTFSYHFTANDNEFDQVEVIGIIRRTVVLEHKLKPIVLCTKHS